jgi:hypothetical protein
MFAAPADTQSSAPSARQKRTFLFMRTEIETIVEEIQQGITLLRRHL